jgi:hypothetical protein
VAKLGGSHNVLFTRGFTCDASHFALQVLHLGTTCHARGLTQEGVSMLPSAVYFEL